MPVEKYNYMIRVGTLGDFNSPKYPFRVFGVYEELRENAKGELERTCLFSGALTRCSETQAFKDPGLDEFVLSDWYCIDTKKIRDFCKKVTKNENFDPLVGGFIGDKTSSAILLGVGNYSVDKDNISSAPISVEELKKTKSIMIDIAFPKFYFDSEKPYNALITKYEVERIQINIESIRFEYRFFKKVSLTDDIGWLFEQTKRTESLVLEKIQTMNFISDLTKEGNKGFFASYFFLNRNEMSHKRRFMKLQDVIAQVSAFVKGVFSIMLFYAVTYALYHLNCKMINNYFRVVIDKDSKVNHSINTSKACKVHTIVGTSAVEGKNEKQSQTIFAPVGFFSYAFLSWYKKSKEQKNRLEFYKLAIEYIDKRLDILSLLSLSDHFEKLVEMTLSEEQQMELHDKRSLNTLK